MTLDKPFQGTANPATQLFQAERCPACGEPLKKGHVGYTAYLTWSRKPGGWAAYFGERIAGTRLLTWFRSVEALRCKECELYVVFPKRKRSR